MSNHRRLTERERSIILRLLEYDFEGRDDLLQQVDLMTARQLDDNGTLELETSGKPSSRVRNRVPAEGYVTDRDGIPVALLLHVIGGQLRELEINKADGSPVVTPFEPNDIRVVNAG